MYSALRFAVEFPRGEPAVMLGLTAGQIASLLIAAIAGAAVVLNRHPRHAHRSSR
ncbi:MAG TPA: prolipoprotein diacylglyceryl transferase [Firmicutes bacterium]|nr:prolipoprotein diacylglyceryl transferase [Bacillota bacterium]